MSDMPAVATSKTELIGRKSLIDGILQGVEQGRRVFALEGISGVGKSAALACAVEALGSRKYCPANLNAADYLSEDMAIAAIYNQLKDFPQDPEAVVQALGKRVGANAPKVLRAFAGAVAADMVKLVTDKAANTTDVLQKLIAGDLGTSPVGDLLDQLEQSNKRTFLTYFLGALADAGTRIVLAIDAVDETNLHEFIRFLISAKPESLVLLLAHNVEEGDNVRWDTITAVVRAKQGLVLPVDPLGHPAVAEWFHRELGRWPTDTELDTLMKQTDGRPYSLQRAFDAIRTGGVAVDADFAGYYLNRRRAMAGDTRTVAELLAVIPRDASVTRDALAVAAAKLGIADIGPSIDKLDQDRWLKQTASSLALAHALARDTWLEGLSGPRKAHLASGWLEAYNQYKAGQLTGQEAAAIIPVIVNPLIQSLPAAEIAEIASALLGAGQVEVGLELVDSGWKFQAGAKGGEDMVQQALLAAKTRLELGRYNEVDEPLAQAERSTNPETQVEALLLRMKLALRRNTYSLLWVLAEQLERIAPDPGHYAEGQATLNVAYRDILDYDGIRETTDKLIKLRDSLAPTKQMSIDRSIARAQAKLGDLDAALSAAERAVEAASELGTARDLGNAHLARGEVHRYRGEFPAAFEDYRVAEELGRGMGNRDSQLWSLLGIAAAQIESGEPDAAQLPLDQVTAMLAEPGYVHPIESAHLQLLRVLAGASAGEVGSLVQAYESLGIRWPRAILERHAGGQAIGGPTPL
jgi:tetratricopeptide (TPR) repeat protein